MPNWDSFLNCLKLSKMPVGVLLNEPRTYTHETRKNLVEEVRKYDISYLMT